MRKGALQREAATRPRKVSVVNTFELLRRFHEDSESISDVTRSLLKGAVSSQGRLSAFSCPEFEILSMSLNTQKAIADGVLDGGYAALDEYRKAVSEKFKAGERRQAAKLRGTVEWYKEQLAQQTETVARLVDEIALMSQRLDEVMALAGQMANSAGRNEEFHKVVGEMMRKFRRP